MTILNASKLVTRICVDDSILISHEASTFISVRATLLRTYASNQSVRVGILISGERQGITNLGIKRLSYEKVITDQPTQIIPGVALMIPTNRRKPAVGYLGASLCVAADRDAWTITRSAVAEQKWLRHCRRQKAIQPTGVHHA